MRSTEDALMRSMMVFVSVAAAACGGSRSGPDNSRFIGSWSGVITAPAVAATAGFSILGAGGNAVSVRYFCSDSSGPSGSVVDANSFRLSPFTCAPSATSTCSTTTLALAGGTGRIASDVLWMTLDATVSGCGSSGAVSFTFRGTKPAPSLAPPNAILVLTPPSPVALGARVTVDTSRSTDPNGRPLRYFFRLDPPMGSAAEITLAATFGAPGTWGFTPDVPGPYVVRLTVTNDVLTTEEVSATVIAGGPGLFPVTAPAIAAAVGETLLLEGTDSADTALKPLQFAWTLQSAPAGSTATLTDADMPVARLAGDVSGAYRIGLQVTDGASAAIASTTAYFFERITRLSFFPIDAKYSRVLDRLVFGSAAPGQLHVFDPVAQTDVSVPLPFWPNSVSISSDGLRAAVGHDAAVSYVDLVEPRVIGTWPLSGPYAADVVLGDPVGTGATPFAFLFPSGAGMFDGIHSVKLSDGTETIFGLHGATRAVKHPSGDRLFALTTNLLPAQLYRVDLGPDGTPAASVEGPYRGDYPMGGDLWVSGDGEQILTSAGTRFRTSDLTYSGSAAFGYSPNPSIVSADWSADQGRWLIQPAQGLTIPSPENTSFWTVQSTDLASGQETAIPRLVGDGATYPVHGRYVFYDSTGTRAVIVGQVSGSTDYIIMKL